MNQLLAAVVNGTALAAAVTAVVWLILRLIPRRMLNAATRYVLWWATLAIAMALPAIDWLGARPDRTPAVAESRPIELPAAARPATPVSHAQIHTPTPASEAPSVPPPSSRPQPAVLPRPIEIPAAGWPRLFFGGWIIAAGVLLVRLALCCALLDRTSRRAYDAPALLGLQVQEWLALCGSTRRRVRLAGSSEIATPVAVGPRHPSILIPAGLLDELKPHELQQVGLHEAAHLSRYDDYALVLQRTIEALLVLNPVVRWITRQIDLEREIACDDLVIAASGHPRSYAACLTRIVELSLGARSSLAAAGAADDTSHLSRRIDLLLDKTRHVSTQLLKTRLAAMLLGVGALGWAAGKTPGFVAFATPLTHPIRQAAAQLFPLPKMVRVAEEPQAERPDFECRVMEDSTGNPMASAELRLRKAGMRELAADLDTDREGHVRVNGLPAGDYTVEVAKPNYLTTSLKLKVPANGLVVRMVRYAAIGGQVLDQQSQPVPARIHAPGGRTVGGTRLVILEKARDSEELRPVREAQSEEDGRYRVHDLPPGQYAVGLWYDGLKDGSGVRLYPDNVHPRIFTLSGGEEIGNIDFQILGGAAYRVAGKVELPKQGQQFALALGLPNQPAIPIAQTLTEPDGSFRFEKIPTGSYDLFVGGPSAGYGAHDNMLGAAPLFARIEVQVSGQNIEGLNIPVSPGRTLTVVLRGKGGALDAPAGCPPSATVTVTPLEPWGLTFRNNVQAGFGKEQAIPNLAPARFRVLATGLPPGCYQVGQTVVDLNRETAPAALELASAGSIRGVLRAESKPATDFSVVLFDASAGSDAQAQLAFPDAQGHFAFQGLRPGRYRIAGQEAGVSSKARWVGDVSRMVEIEVAGGGPTDVELPVAVKAVVQ